MGLKSWEDYYVRDAVSQLQYAMWKISAMHLFRRDAQRLFIPEEALSVASRRNHVTFPSSFIQQLQCDVPLARKTAAPMFCRRSSTASSRAGCISFFASGSEPAASTVAGESTAPPPAIEPFV